MEEKWWLDAQPVTPSSAETEGVLLPVAPEKPREAPSGYRYGPTGTLEFIPGGPADPTAPRPGSDKPTEGQQKTLQLLTRIAGGARNIQDALDIDPEAQTSGLFEALSRDVLGEGIITRNIAGENRRIVTDAQANMLDAILTMGTGAAYNEEQKVANAIAYFPQYGDTPREIAIKNNRINEAIASARLAAGPLADEFDKVIAPLFGQAGQVADDPESAGQVTPTEVISAVAGEPQVTRSDQEIAGQLQAAWNAGASPDEISDLSVSLGRAPLRDDQKETLRNRRATGTPASFRVEPTGTVGQLQGLLGSLTQGPVGESAAGYFGSAANALTAGFAVPQDVKEYLRETAPVSSFAGEVTGGALATVPAIRGMQGVTAGTRLASAAPLLGETAYGALYGAGEAGEGNRLEGAAYGGAGALLLGGLANRFTPGGPGTFTGAPRTSAATRAGFTGAPISPEEIIAAGQRENIPVLTSDIFPPQGRLSQTISNVATYAPFGPGAQRVAQQEARVGAVENTLRDFGVTVDADFAADAARSLSDTKGRRLTFLTGEKDSIIQRFSGDDAVPTTNAVAAIDNQLGRLRSQNLKSLNPLIDELENIRSSLTGPGDLAKLEANRATIFGLKGDPGLGSIASTSEKVFNNVYRALNDDIGSYVRSEGGDAAYDAWKSVNTELAEMAGELSVGGLRNALNKGEFDPNIVTRMLTQQKPGDLQALSRNLSQNGRANVRSLLLQRAGQKALTPDNIVDPTRFAKEVASMSDSFGAFFNQSDMLRLQGLVDVLNATRSAKYASELPATGASLTPLMVLFGAGGSAASESAGGAFAGVVAPLAAGTAFGLSRRVLESPRARDLLLRISKASESKKGQLIGQFLSYATAAMGAQAGSAMGPSPAPTEPAPSAVNIR